MNLAWHLMVLYSFLIPDTTGNGCPPGFKGTTCHKQNTALNKPAFQSDTFETNYARLAVDGNNDTHVENGYCSHTDSTANAYWTVILTDTIQYNITQFTLYLRNKFADRYNNLRILVDGNLCQNINISGNSGPPIPNPVNGQCDQSLTGNNVSIHVDNAYLSLCEVQIWVCSNGWFGDECENACKCLNTTDVCDKETGYCRSGCARGYHGDGCQTECPGGFFGNCSQRCNCQTSTEICNKTTGVCHHSGCTNGTYEPDCQTECIDGLYGDGCGSVCGNCSRGDVCDKVNGSCNGGCQVGFRPPLCRECAVGFYGDCSSKCGHCRNNASCDIVTGVCPYGCQDGYIPPLCQGIVRDGPGKTSFHVGAIVGGGVATVLAVIAVALGIFFLRRKSRRARNKSSTNEDIQLDDTENVYDTLRVYFNEDNTYTHLSEGNLKKFIKDKIAADGTENVNIQRLYDKSRTDEESGTNQPNSGESSCRENSPGTDSTRNAVSDCCEGELYTIAKDPTHLTVNEFWKMIWQRKVTQIVMLTHSTEMAQSMQYWPEENGRMTIGDININSSSETTRANFAIRDFIIQQKAPQSPRRTVTQFHFTTWPDHSYPPVPSLLTFLKRVTKSNRGSENDGPILVHCRSKGARTGGFIALHSLMTQVKKELDGANVVQNVAKFLQTRGDLLESEDQFQFVYETLLEALESRGTFFTQLEFDEKYGRDLPYTVEQEKELRIQFQALGGLKKELSQEVLSEALLSENINKNRCQDILPAIRTRPYLPNPVTGMNDYINAVVLTSYTRPASFLVTQTPLEETVVDFWRLVYHHNCNTIVCLDDSQDALSLYPRQNTSTGVGVFQIETVMEDRSRDSFTELHLSLSHKEQNNSRRDIRVFLTPISNASFSQESSSTFLSIVQHLEDNGIQGDRKILVHCLDGSCMSGVFCSVMNIVSRLRLDKEVDIFLAIRELQAVRPQFVQTYAQYKLCYDVVKEYHRHSNTYINMGVTSDMDME